MPHRTKLTADVSASASAVLCCAEMSYDRGYDDRRGGSSSGGYGGVRQHTTARWQRERDERTDTARMLIAPVLMLCAVGAVVFSRLR